MSDQKQGVTYFMSMLGPKTQALVAVFFLFTIWSVFTNFDLGGILNKYADASLEQSQMQFEAQLRLQELQFKATEESNQKLELLISSVSEVTKRMDAQAERVAEITRRLGEIETTVGLVVQWTCDHEKLEKPGYCDAIVTTDKVF